MDAKKLTEMDREYKRLSDAVDEAIKYVVLSLSCACTRDVKVLIQLR